MVLGDDPAVGVAGVGEIAGRCEWFCEADLRWEGLQCQVESEFVAAPGRDEAVEPVFDDGLLLVCGCDDVGGVGDGVAAGDVRRVGWR